MKIIIADHHILFREGLVSLLEKQADITVVGEAGTGSELVTKAADLRPDLVLLDANLSGIEDFSIIQTILHRCPETKVVILAVQETEDLIVAALRCGAKGYIPKNTSLSKLISSIKALERGEMVLSRAMTGRVLEELIRLLVGNNDLTQRLADLTAREVDVLRYVADGATNRQIADQLVITENTVKVHIHNILDKLHVQNRRDAAKFARKNFLAASQLDSSMKN